MKSKSRGSKIKKTFKVLAGLVVVTAVGSALYVRREFVASADTLPSTLEHLKSLGVPTHAHEIKPPKGLTADNNAAYLYRDFQKVVETGLIRDFHDRVAIARAMKESKPSDPWERRPRKDPLTVLPLLRRAADREYCWFFREWILGFELLLPEYAYLKSGAKALAVEAEYAAMNGDVDSAIADIRRIHRIGAHAAQEPILIAHLVGAACDDIATLTAERLGTIWKDEPSRLDLLAAEMESWPRMPSIRSAMASELICGLGVAPRPSYLLAAMGGTKPSLPMRALDIAVAVDPVLWEGVKADYAGSMLRFLSGLAAVGDDDWRAQKAVATAYDNEMTRDERWVGKYKQILSPVFAPACTSWVKVEARRATTIGLLRKLAGSHTMPNDPYTDQPLLVKNADNGFLVYSVGDDLQDDGGKTKGDLGLDIVARFPQEQTTPAAAR